MISRNTIVGVDLLALGFVLAGLGYILAQSIPIAAIGVDIAILGALVLLVVPEPVPQDAYAALLKDSISNIELILEEAHLEERAYFLPASKDGGAIRAFVPALSIQREQALNRSALLQKSFSSRFISSYRDQVGVFLIPPGNELVRLSGVAQGDDLGDALRSAIVSFSDLSSSIIAEQVKEGTRKLVKINISNPKVVSDLPFFERCLGSPLSCIASCVVSTSLGAVIRLVDEVSEGDLIHTTLEIIE